MKRKLKELYEKKAEIEVKIKLENYRIIYKIIKLILKRNNITMAQIRSGIKTNDIVICKHEIHYIISKLFCKSTRNHVNELDKYFPVKMTLEEVGELTNSKHDHVIHSRKIIENLIKYDKKYCESFSKFVEQFKNSEK